MKVRLSVDRFEGKDYAVLLTDDGRQINFPRTLLPRGNKAGEVITLAISRAEKATERLRADTRLIPRLCLCASVVRNSD